MTFQSVIRTLLFPFRYAVVKLPRSNRLRSLSAFVLKPAERRPWLMSGLKEIRPLDDSKVTFAATDSMVLTSTYWFGIQGYEGILSEVWKALCRDARAVLEIGGNIGFFTVLGARESRSPYLVVEPVPHIAKALRDNLSRNSVDHVEVREAAAIPAGEPSVVTLTVPREGRLIPTGASLKSGTEVGGRSTDYEIAVQGEPMARLVASRDLIKIDAEGIEHALIAACSDELEKNKPSLVLEVLPGSVRLAEQVRRLAKNCGYRLLIIPAYRSDTLIEVAAEDFAADLPSKYYSKDIVLTLHSLPQFAVRRAVREAA